MKNRAFARCAGILLVAGSALATTAWSQTWDRDELDRLGLEEPPVAEDESVTPRPSGAPVGPTVLSVTVILQDGDMPAGGGGGTVDLLNIPFTNGDGEVGFNGSVDSDHFVWFDNGITFLDSSVVSPVLSGGESVMGIGDDGEFIYSPSIDGDDGVWTDLGFLAVEETAAPGFPMGTITTFHSRPTMDDTGQAYWVAGLNMSGGTSTEARTLYTSADRMSASITPLLSSGDMVGGFTISSGSSGIDFDYQFSGDGSNHIHVLDMDTGSTTNDIFLYVDGTLVARESNATGDGDNWANFDTLTINNAGQYLFSGDTDGATGTDEFIAFGVSPGAPTIAIREGDVIDGVTLTSSALVRTVTVNDDGCAAHAWSVSGGTEHVFIGEADSLSGTSDLIISTGDSVDVDGNGTADATFTDLNTFGPTFHLNESNVLFLEVDLDYGGGDLEAIIAIQYNGASCALPVALQSFSID